MGKRLQPARFRNLYGSLQLRETAAAYGGLRQRLRGLVVDDLYHVVDLCQIAPYCYPAIYG